MLKLKIGDKMITKIKDLINNIDPSFFRYIIVGIINTIFGTSIMFIFYNVLGFGYWPSSAANYFFGSILSFFLNKYFTFQSKTTSLSQVVRFIINIVICYFIGYGIAQPLTKWILSGTGASQAIQDNISMAIGMVLYVILNYFGQRLFVFNKDK